METATSPKRTASAESELETRRKSTARTVQGLLIGVVLLCVLAFVSKKFLTAQHNPSLHMAVLITILGLGLGAIAFRRTRFSAMRLQNVAALRGASGLLITLQRTTLQIALLGATAAVVGFGATLATGDDTYSYRAGLVAVAVLLYCYPLRNAWQRALQRFSPAQKGTDSQQHLS
jgi:anaerobic C4-dicarboxylate transporter